MNLYQIHFDQWLKLFQESIDALFNGPIADDAKKRANIMAILFISKINHNRENGGVHLV
jgi:hemoglobin